MDRHRRLKTRLLLWMPILLLFLLAACRDSAPTEPVAVDTPKIAAEAPTATATATGTASPTATETASPSPTSSATATHTATLTETAVPTPTDTAVPSDTPSLTSGPLMLAIVHTNDTLGETEPCG